MFAAIILICGLNPSPMTPEGCTLAVGNVPFAEERVCNMARVQLTFDLKQRLPKGDYIVKSECFNMGRTS